MSKKDKAQEVDELQWVKMRTVGLRFEENGVVYPYFVPEDDNPQIGDIVVTSCALTLQGEAWKAHVAAAELGTPPVRSRLLNPVSNGEPLSLEDGDPGELKFGKGLIRFARVVQIDAWPNDKAKKFYLLLLSAEDMQSRRNANDRMLEEFNQRKELIERLDTLVLQQSKMDIYKKLADQNPEARKLFEQLTAGR